MESKDKNVRLNEVEEVQIKHESSMMKKDGERNNNLVYLGWEAFRVGWVNIFQYDLKPINMLWMIMYGIVLQTIFHEY